MSLLLPVAGETKRESGEHKESAANVLRDRLEATDCTASPAPESTPLKDVSVRKVKFTCMRTGGVVMSDDRGRSFALDCVEVRQVIDFLERTAREPRLVYTMPLKFRLDRVADTVRLFTIHPAYAQAFGAAPAANAPSPKYSECASMFPLKSDKADEPSIVDGVAAMLRANTRCACAVHRAPCFLLA